jgi:hypothetical protein
MKTSKAGLALVLAMGLFSAGLPAESAQAAAFTDIKGHWAESQIEAMAKRGVIHGYPDGSFHPDAPVAVDEFMVMAWYNVSDQVSGVRDFADWWIFRMDARSRSSLYAKSRAFEYDKMGQEYWASPYIFQSDLFGMIPKNASLENPWNSDYTKPLTREYAAYILERLVVYSELYENEKLLQLLEPIVPDLQEIKTPMSGHSILNLMAKGIMTGDPDGAFYPQRVLTRAEALSILERMHDPSLRTPRLPDLTGHPHAMIPIMDYKRMFLFQTQKGLQNYNALHSVADTVPGTVKESDMTFYFFKSPQEEKDAEGWFLQNGSGVYAPFQFAIAVNDEDQDLFPMLIKNKTNVQDAQLTAFDKIMQKLFGDQKQEAKNTIAAYLEKNRNQSTFDEHLQIGGRSVHLFPHPNNGSPSTQLHLEIK